MLKFKSVHIRRDQGVKTGELKLDPLQQNYWTDRTKKDSERIEKIYDT